MNTFYIFIMRAILGAFFAVILTRFFRPDISMIYVALLGIFLVAMAYLLEYLRKRKSK